VRIPRDEISAFVYQLLFNIFFHMFNSKWWCLVVKWSAVLTVTRWTQSNRVLLSAFYDWYAMRLTRYPCPSGHHESFIFSTTNTWSVHETLHCCRTVLCLCELQLVVITVVLYSVLSQVCLRDVSQMNHNVDGGNVSNMTEERCIKMCHWKSIKRSLSCVCTLHPCSKQQRV